MKIMNNLRKFYFYEINQIDTVNQDTQEYMTPMLIMDILEISCYTCNQACIGVRVTRSLALC